LRTTRSRHVGQLGVGRRAAGTHRYGYNDKSLVKVKYDMSDISHGSAAEVCEAKGAELCCASDICPEEHGKPQFEVRHRERKT